MTTPRRDAAFLLALGLGLAAWSAGDALRHAPHVAGVAALGAALPAWGLRARLAALHWALAGAALLPLPHWPATAAPAACRLTALSFNAKLLRVPDTAAVQAVLRAHPADIAFVQEAAGLPADTHPHAIRSERLNLLILSRFPLEPEPSPEGGLAARAALGEGRALRLLTAIAPKPHPEPEAALAFARALAAWADGSTLLGLSLNAGPASRPARALTAGLRDAQAEAGHGIGATFPTAERRLGALGPWLRVDYLMAGPGLAPMAAEVLPDRARSTHLPVRATFAIPCEGPLA